MLSRASFTVSTGTDLEVEGAVDLILLGAIDITEMGCHAGVSVLALYLLEWWVLDLDLFYPVLR